MRIAPFSPEIKQDIASPVSGAGKASSTSFADELKSTIQEVNNMQNQSDQAMLEGSVNGATNVHESMIKLQEADISLRLFSSVRNKALDAYQQIMRMQF
jgi:flagellar hook-basal body complex protein FliE